MLRERVVLREYQPRRKKKMAWYGIGTLLRQGDVANHDNFSPKNYTILAAL